MQFPTLAFPENSHSLSTFHAYVLLRQAAQTPNIASIIVKDLVIRSVYLDCWVTLPLLFPLFFLFSVPQLHSPAFTLFYKSFP